MIIIEMAYVEKVISRKIIIITRWRWMIILGKMVYKSCEELRDRLLGLGFFTMLWQLLFS